MVGRTISHYKVLSELGRGGMGIVYKAEDLKLKRPVALKFLRSDVLEDEEHKERFLREAQAAAALDHPNICTVYEIDEVEGQTFLSMAYLEGQTVKEKIKVRPLKLEEALDIAIQTAQGLQAAHEKGIVHRDIKSSNLMVTPQGQVKIMDFGLAQLADRSKLTKTTASLGTPSYMSPEQAQKSKTDRRTDIWSLGVVVYEMVTGRLPFEREREQAVLYSIVNEEPEVMTAQRVDVPVELDHVVSKAMAKSPDERYQHVDEMLVDLRAVRKDAGGAQHAAPLPGGGTAPGDDVGARHVAPAAGETGSQVRKLRLNLAVALAALALALGLNVFQWLDSPSSKLDQPVRRFVLHANDRAREPVISPNGNHIAYVVAEPGRKLWVQDLDSDQPREIEGSEGATSPFWSPDSAFVGFFTDQDLNRVSVQGGSIVTVCQKPGVSFWDRRGTWSPDGESIVFNAGTVPQLYEVPSAGGEPKPLRETLDTGEERATFAHFLPTQTGRKALVFTRGTQLVVHDFETSQQGVLTNGEWAAYSPTGHIVYQADGLWALRFSMTELKPLGDPFLVNKRALRPSIAVDGTFVYQDLDTRRQQLIWCDRGGRKLAAVGRPQERIYLPELSPDGRFVAVAGTENGNQDIWIHDVARDVATRITSEPRAEGRPIWSPTGSRIAFFVTTEGGRDVFLRSADGTGESEALLSGPESEMLSDWSRDGRYLVYQFHFVGGETLNDLWYLKLKADGSGYESVPFLRTGFQEQVAKLSPDGRFIAYCSNESGQEEVYLQLFPQGGDKLKISPDGGTQPRWSPDGKELFYVEHDTLVAVSVTLKPAFSVGSTTRLFSHPGLIVPYPAQQYDVSADGQRFILKEIVVGPDDQPPAIRVVQNWYAEFRNREQD